MNQPARQHQLLELHSIEYIAYQWDGSKNQAQVVTRELQRELPMRSASLLTAGVKLRTSNVHDDSVELRVEIERKADGRIFLVELTTFEWLVVSLHEGRIFDVVKLPSYIGDGIFRRVAPSMPLKLGEPLKLPSA